MSKKPLGLAPPKLQRITLDIQHYAPTVVYKTGKDQHITDLLSRDYTTTESAVDKIAEDMGVHSVLPMGENDFNELVRDETGHGTAKHSMSSTGWLAVQRIFAIICNKLLIYESLLYIATLETWKGTVPKAMHNNHIGINSSLGQTREMMYWPGVSKDIADLIQRCKVRETSQRWPAKELLQQKEVLNLSWK